MQFHKKMQHMQVQVTDQPLTSLRVMDSGRIAAVGSADGTTTIVQFSDGLVDIQPNEKQALTSVSCFTLLTACSSIVLYTQSKLLYPVTACSSVILYIQPNEKQALTLVSCHVSYVSCSCVIKKASMRHQGSAMLLHPEKEDSEEGDRALASRRV